MANLESNDAWDYVILEIYRHLCVMSFGVKLAKSPCRCGSLIGREGCGSFGSAGRWSAILQQIKQDQLKSPAPGAMQRNQRFETRPSQDG